MYDFLVWQLLQPYPLILLLMALGLAMLWRKHRDARKRLWWVALPYVLLLVLSLPAVAFVLEGTLEWRFAPLEQRPSEIQAIVVLGSAVRRPEGSRLRAELDEDGLHRCLEAAELYHQGPPCPILVSGGLVEAGQGELSVAEGMRQHLVSLGVAPTDILVEDHSRTTYENAAESCRLLAEHGWTKVVLVTDAFHMTRARACFRKQGLEPVPACCHYRAASFQGQLENFWPNPRALGSSQQVWHEWLGLTWYWLRGRI